MKKHLLLGLAVAGLVPAASQAQVGVGRGVRAGVAPARPYAAPASVPGRYSGAYGPDRFPSNYPGWHRGRYYSTWPGNYLGVNTYPFSRYGAPAGAAAAPYYETEVSYSGPVNPAPPVPAYADVPEGASALPAADANAAHVRVRVPADARVWLNDTAMTATGRERSFVSPALDPGTEYTYQVRARWLDNGREVNRTQEVTVRAGGTAEVDFTAAPARRAPRSADLPID
jgi:uncharacterized protein (TIGR03000 family)